MKIDRTLSENDEEDYDPEDESMHNQDLYGDGAALMMQPDHACQSHFESGAAKHATVINDDIIQLGRFAPQPHR